MLKLNFGAFARLAAFGLVLTCLAAVANANPPIEAFPEDVPEIASASLVGAVALLGFCGALVGRRFGAKR